MTKQKEEIFAKMGDPDVFYSCVPNYQGYIAATTNGIVRMDNDTPLDVKGLSTFALKTCFAIILKNGQKVSLIHFTPKATSLESIVREIKWLGGSKDTKVLIYINENFYKNHPSHIRNRDSALEEVYQTFDNSGIREENISRFAANNGAILVERQLHKVSTYDEPLAEGSLVGTVSPYFVLRNAINMLSRGKVVNKEALYPDADLQYDGKKWNKLPKLRSSIFSEANLEELGTLKMDDMKKKIMSLPSFKDLLTCPGLVNDQSEIDFWLESISRSIIEYTAAKQAYQRSIIPYKMFSCSQEQESLIQSIGGKVREEKDRGMYIIDIPSKFLTKDVRQALKIDRIRLTNMDPIPDLVIRHLSENIKGWRGETDSMQLNASLLTFPYKNEKHREELRNKVDEILKANNRINNNSGEYRSK